MTLKSIAVRVWDFIVRRHGVLHTRSYVFSLSKPIDSNDLYFSRLLSMDQRLPMISMICCLSITIRKRRLANIWLTSISILLLTIPWNQALTTCCCLRHDNFRRCCLFITFRIRNKTMIIEIPEYFFFLRQQKMWKFLLFYSNLWWMMINAEFLT